MKKDFNDFLTVASNEKLNDVANEIISELNDKIPKDDSIASLLLYNRSFNTKMTLKLLELYHNWDEN